MDAFIKNILVNRKEYLEARVSGKAETIRIYTVEINKAQETIDKDLKEIELINGYLEDKDNGK